MRAGQARVHRCLRLLFLVGMCLVLGNATATAQGTVDGPILAIADAQCQPLPPATGNTIEVTPAQASELSTIVQTASSGDTILLHDGTYALDGDYLWFDTDGVTLRSYSGNPEAVIIDGNYETTEIVTVYASNVTIAEVTLQRAYTHGIHVFPPDNRSTVNTLIHRVRVIDPGEQGIKVNANSGPQYTDYGTIACSRIELTDAGRPHIRNDCYTGGIDVHQARGWVVRDSFIKGFWCEDGISEHGIHFWTGSRDTIVERNVLVDNVRGIGFGLVSSGSARTYADEPCSGASGYVDHYDGIIRNNFIAQYSAALYASDVSYDCGICLAQACDAKVLNNTVVSRYAPFSSIEWRFGNTDAEITNNLVSHNLEPRDGASATLVGNQTGASLSLFVDPPSGDLHLASGSSAPVNAGVAIAAGECPDDIDGGGRPNGSGYDVGADEWGASTWTAYIPLAVGWNLASLPVVPGSASIADVLSSIAGQYEVVMSHIDPWSEEWLWYDPANVGSSTLTTLNETTAFWIKMTQSATLSVSGARPGTTSIALRAGWNLVPFPSTSSQDISGALDSISASYAVAYGYAAGPDGGWRRNGGSPTWANSLTQLEPGSGYWLRVDAPCTLRIQA